MASAISNWMRGLVERNSADENMVLPTSQMVGAYPEENSRPETSNTLSSRLHRFGAAGKWIQVLLVKPIVLVLVIGVRILAVVLNLIFVGKQDTRIGRHMEVYSSVSQSFNAIDKVFKFERDLEENLTGQELGSGASLPPFFKGSYTQALYMATQRAKFLFVYLCNPQTESSSMIFKHIITDPKFLSIFRDNPNIIIWGGDVTNPEAYQMANSLNVTKFPFIGLLCLTRTVTMSQQGPVKTPAKVSLVSKVQGKFGDDVDPKALIDKKFIKKIEKYEEDLGLIRAELRDKFLGQVILKQQDINFQTSLARDKKKKELKERKLLKKKYLAYRLPYFKALVADKNTEGKAKIAIKMPDGKRITVFFPAESTVEDIFTYVELHKGDYLENDNLNSTMTEDEAQNTFKNIAFDYSFSLSSPLPPRTVLDSLRTSEIKDVDCIYPNGLLHVENV